MIGIILAGGKASRLYPLSVGVSKHLLPIHDKPMIYYPLTTLMFTGVREIFIVVNPQHLSQFMAVLGDGSQWGLRIHFVIQEQARGIADCFGLIPDEFQEESCVVCLGDNFFYGMGLGATLREAFSGHGALCFGYEVADPTSYGVIELDRSGHPLQVVEKPSRPVSNTAIPGLYWFDQACFEFATSLQPSARGELEITDLLRMYLSRGTLAVKILPRGTAWLDAGVAESLSAVSNFVAVLEQRQGLKIGSPEEVALREGLIDKSQFIALTQSMPTGPYKDYLEKVSRVGSQY
jgi:glucose-1-phosphate thymidylyltransferase